LIKIWIKVKNPEASGNLSDELRRTSRRFPPPWSDFSLCHPSQHFLITIVIQGSGANASRKPIRYIAYGLAIFAALFVLAFTTDYLSRHAATASHFNEPNYTAVR
jgi:hypothetical protein